MLDRASSISPYNSTSYCILYTSYLPLQQTPVTVYYTHHIAVHTQRVDKTTHLDSAIQDRAVLIGSCTRHVVKVLYPTILSICGQLVHIIIVDLSKLFLIINWIRITLETVDIGNNQQQI